MLSYLQQANACKKIVYHVFFVCYGCLEDVRKMSFMDLNNKMLSNLKHEITMFCGRHFHVL